MDINCVLDKLKNDEVLNREKKVIVAFSGGPDSTFMVHILRKYLPSIKVYLYHLNHNIRENAVEDENFVRYLSEKYDLKLFISKKDIPRIAKESKVGLEEAGRIERYKDLRKLSNQLDVNTIITAHHLDDDIETFLMNYKRGSGINGYASIKEREGLFLRPLLGVNKDFILNYLKDNNISYCLDETNFVPDTLRNDLRINVIPKLKKLDSEFYKNFSSFLSTMKLEYRLKLNFIDAFIEEYNLSDEKSTFKFNLEDTKKFFGDDLTSLFYHIIAKINGNTVDVYKSQLMGINTIAKSNEEKRIEIMGVLFIKSFDWLIFKKSEKKDDRKFYFSENQSDETIDFIAPKYVKGDLIIRNREVGDKIKLFKRPVKSLKKLMIENKIPAFKRDELFVVADEEDILYVEMIGRAERAFGGNKKIYINERKHDE